MPTRSTCSTPASTARRTAAALTRPSAPHGDNHDLWIDLHDPDRMIEANDGGVNVSTNGGRTWSSAANQPTAQFYRVALDNDFPYHAYGAQQDNTTVRTATRACGGITERDWYDVGGGAERLDRASTSQFERRLRRILWQSHHSLRRLHRRAAQYQSVARQSHGTSGRRFEAALPVELPDRHLAARSQGDLRRRQRPVQEHRRRTKLGANLEGPDPRRQDAPPRFLRRSHHQGQHQHRVLLHHLHRQRIAEHQGSHLVWVPTTAWSASRAIGGKTSGSNVTPFERHPARMVADQRD